MLKKFNLIGVIIGVLIIVFSVLVFSFNAIITTPDMEEVSFEEISAPEYETDEIYGGDAYTGMQQASAQAANNIIPVFNAVQANNDAINELNNNIIKAANADANNAEVMVATIKFCAGFVLLSIGLIVISKSIEIEILEEL